MANAPSIHGFSATKRCVCAECSLGDQLSSVGLLKDPAPTLFIQDEMHLLTESLGTFDSHYESFINYYVKELLPPTQRKQIRFVGATATISMYKAHIRELYHMEGRRFPCEYPSAKQGKDFYSFTDETIKSVYPYEMGEGVICDFVRTAVKADLAEKFPSGHTGCLSTAVVEAISADVYFDKKKEFESDRAGADVYLQNHAGNSSYAVAFTERRKEILDGT